MTKAYQRWALIGSFALFWLGLHSKPISLLITPTVFTSQI